VKIDRRADHCRNEIGQCYIESTCGVARRMKSFEGFRLDSLNQCLWRGDARVPLMPKPFAVLEYLVEHAGRLVTQDELLTAIWPDTFVQPEVLRRYILEIRRALGDAAERPRFIETRPKRGYQFVAVVTSDSAPISDGTSTDTVRLVGRESALAALNGYLDATLHGQRQIVFVVGEPGIGKTTLVDAFQRAVARRPDLCVARGQSVEGFGGKEPYYPVFEAIGQLARSPARTLVIQTLTATAPTWLIQFPSLVRADQHAALARDAQGATRERMVRELCEAIETITHTMAMVLVIEDLHWADHSTIDLISAIARRREPARLLIIGTVRPADLIVSESPLKTLKQDLLLHRLGHELSLEPLQESDVAAYLAVAYQRSELPAALAKIIHRQSDGNPLFMVAMLDHLEQHGVLTRADGHWRMAVPVEDVHPGVPETLKQMLEMQMAHLTDAQRRMLKCASVDGQRFTVWSLATMLGVDTSELEEECARLAERQQFLKASGVRELPNGTVTAAFEFRHALYREVLYRALTSTQRVLFHRLLAEGLERLQTRVNRELATELALHFEEGHEYVGAVRYLMLAAANATRRYAHREAIAVLEHARELLPRVGEEQRDELMLQVLERIGNAFYALGDMEQSGATYQLMATRAAESGLLAAQAEALIRTTHPAESIPFFVRAVEIDPGLASAYTSLSRIYSTLGEAERAKEYAKLAYEHREHVSERDRLSITYQYHFEVTGNQSRATETLDRWKALFPGEFQPVNSLAFIHNFLGRFDRAIEEGQEAVRRNPRHGYPYSNLAQAYRGMGRFDEARRVAERAVALEIETLPTRRLLYQLATIEGDEEAALRHLEWARDKPREFEMVAARAQALACAGRVSEARQLYEEAARTAELRALGDVGTGHLAWASWMEMAYGNTDAAQRLAHRVLARNPSYDPRLRAALTLAVSGLASEAERIACEAANANPEHTFINSVLAPIVRAGIELSRGQPTRALAQLEIVVPYELGFIAALAPLHLRAHSLLMQCAGAEAAREFQRILDHRGSDLFSPFYGVARLGLAQARAMSGDVKGSLEAYEQFLSAWHDADSDIPVLRQARKEYRR
jgi:DNA-binding winged helix-turn-helix (wHTH) protein/tetratricopeptide (TPR) repeat protein